ncbi:hypothetical protein F5Y17DRAFT_80203 [Xylariaceae sp. FL0594]|nr:hypothetical protein F5Y17DRAFT_80203 [Xylariaceae sp. FL0594]
MNSALPKYSLTLQITKEFSKVNLRLVCVGLMLVNIVPTCCFPARFFSAFSLSVSLIPPCPLVFSPWLKRSSGSPPPYIRRSSCIPIYSVPYSPPPTSITPAIHDAGFVVSAQPARATFLRPQSCRLLIHLLAATGVGFIATTLSGLGTVSPRRRATRETAGRQNQSYQPPLFGLLTDLSA